tara:strand:+ start:7614 stop:7739 length:126 start_codon:yes stop_codon:yes gene_type:complete
MNENGIHLLLTLSIVMVPAVIIGAMLLFNDLTGFSDKYGKK